MDSYPAYTVSFDRVNLRRVSKIDTKPYGEAAEVSPHWFTCTHLGDCDKIIQEAEKLVIFSSKDGDWVHVSIQHEGWYSCKPITTTHYESMNTPELLSFIQEELRFLKTIQ